MTISTGFFDAAREYTAQEFARALRAATSPGAVLGIGNVLAVTAGPGLGVTVDTGFAMLLGDWLYNDGAPVVTVALLAADPSLPRKDRIVVRLTISTKTVEITKLTGTPNGSPSLPSLTLTSDVYEIPLAWIDVPAAAGSITSGNVHDERQYAGPTVHDIIAGHAASGLTAGDVITALTATTFGFRPPNKAYHSAHPNGDFLSWAKGTSFAALGNGAAHADMWFWNLVGTGVVTISRDTDVPAVGANAVNTPYSCKIATTTADASIAVGDLYALYGSIEGFDYRTLTNGFAVSFWIKATKTGTYCFFAMNRGNDRTYVAEFTVSASNTWEYKTLTIPAPPTAGTWDYATGLGLTIGVTLAAGANWQTTAGAWQAGGFRATANQVNAMDSAVNIVRVALVNVIPGTNPQPLLPRPIAEVQERCRRYVQALHHGVANERYGTGQCISTTQAVVPVPLPTPMLATPTATFAAAATFQILNAAGGSVALTAIALSNPTPNVLALLATVAAGLVGGNAALLLDNGAGTSTLVLEAYPV